ncbi:MAG: hypothetical protein U0840_17625 [Gemmataceae bacterium]
MLARSVLNLILEDERLTQHLGDAEARVLVEWLVEEAETLAESGPLEAVAATVRQLCRRARSLGRFVVLWAIDGDRQGATQLAACERFTWPLPTRAVDPCRLMEYVVGWEAHQRRQAA